MCIKLAKDAMRLIIKRDKNILRGFTLIELLVVISIIALLLAILMPGLNKAKKSAQAVVCSAHLKQVGLAFDLYAQDFKNYVPYAGYDHLPSNWDTVLITRYLSGSFRIRNPGGVVEVDVLGPTNIFSCPADKIQRYNNNNKAARSFTMSGFEWAPDRWRNKSVNRLKIKSPSSVFSVLEWHVYCNILGNNWAYSLARSSYNYGDQFLGVTSVNAGMYYTPNMGKFHSGRATYLFYDGHTEKLTFEEASRVVHWKSPSN